MTKYISVPNTGYICSSKKADLQNADSWEIQSEFTLKTENSNYACLVCANSDYIGYNYYNSSYGYPGYKFPQIWFTNQGYIGFSISSNGTSFNLYSNTSSSYLGFLEKYRLRGGFREATDTDASHYYIDVSHYNDGSNPKLTTNGSMGGSSPACASSGSYNGSWYTFGNTWEFDQQYDYTDTWITYYNPTPVVVNKIAYMQTRYTGYKCVKDFKLYGSNDNSTWVELTTVTDVPRMSRTKYYYEFENTESYQYYKFSITGKYSGDSNRIYMGKFFLFGFNEPYWEDYTNMIYYQTTTKAVGSSSVAFFNNLGEISENNSNKMFGENNLTATKLSYMKDGVEHIVFDGANLVDGNYFNTGCTIEDTIVSNFSSTQYIKLPNKVITNVSDVQTIYLRIYLTSVSNEMSIMSDIGNLWITRNGSLVLTDKNNNPTYGTKEKKLELNKWYFLAYSFDGKNHKVFTMEDTDTYTLDKLPTLPKVVVDENGESYLEQSDWVFQLRKYSSEKLFGDDIYLGSNKNNTAWYFRGKIDLNYILNGKNVLWYNVSAPTYLPKSEYMVVENDSQIAVDLSAGYTFTVSIDQDDADIVINSRGYTQVGNTMVVNPGTVINYSVKKKGYKGIKGSYVMEDSDYTLTLTMEETTAVYLEMTYPFVEYEGENYSELIEPLFDGDLFKITNSNSIQAITNADTTGNHGITYVKYFSFTTPGDLDSYELKVTGYVSSESGCDFGAVYCGTQPYGTTGTMSYSQVAQQVPDGYGTFLFGGSGSMTESEYTMSLAPNTTYYLHLCWAKDGSVSRNNDSLIVSKINLTYVPN